MPHSTLLGARGPRAPRASALNLNTLADLKNLGDNTNA